MPSLTFAHGAHRFFRHHRTLQTGVIDRIILTAVINWKTPLIFTLGDYVCRENLVFRFHRTWSMVVWAVRS